MYSLPPAQGFLPCLESPAAPSVARDPIPGLDGLQFPVPPELAPGTPSCVHTAERAPQPEGGAVV